MGSAANQKLYAADPQYWSPGDIDKGQLCTYDAVTGSAHLETITCDAPGDSQYCDPAGLAVSGDGHRLYIATPDWLNPHPNPSFVIKDLVADTQTVVVDNAFPDGFALSPDDTTLYVTGLACNRIGVYDARTGDHLYDVPMDGFTMGIDLSADGKHLYVAQTDTASYFQQSHTGESGFIRYVTDQVIYYYPCPPIVPKPRTLPTPVIAP